MSREISLGALGIGALLGVVFAGAAMYVGLKTGIVDGGNIPAVILAFGLLTAAFGRRPTSTEGNIVQTVSSSAAMMAITGGLIGPVAALALAGSEPPLALVIAWGIAVGVVGCLLAVPLRAAFITHGSLAFPSGAAAGEVLDEIYRAGRSAASRLRMLAIGGVAAFGFAFARSFFGWIPELTVFPVAIGGVAANAIGLGVGWSPLFAATGYLAGARTAVSLVVGSAIAWLAIAPQLVSAGIAKPDYLSLLSWLLWSGTGLMLGGTLAGVIGAWRDLRRSLRDVAATGGFRTSRAHALGLVAGIAGVIVLGTLAFDVHPVFPALGLVLSAVLAAAAARAVGETDYTPAGPLGGFAQLVVGAAAPGGIAAPLAGGGTVNGTLMHSASMLQNWKAGARVGTPPRAQLVAQLVGVAVGALACAAFYVLIRRAYGLGTDEIPAPAALSWKATAEIVQHGVSAMPAYAPHAAAIAFGLGFVLCIKPLERRAPSPVAMGIAFILPPYLSLTIAIGGLASWLAARKSRRVADEQGVALASGVIGGEAIAGLLIAGLIVAEMSAP